MKKEKKPLVQQASDYIVHKSTIANGLKYLYLEADSSMIQLLRAHQRITSVFNSVGATTKKSPELGALKNYYTAIKQATYFFDEFVSRMITDATWGANEGDNRTRSYENWRADANAFAKFSLLFFDRTYCDPEQQKKIFDFIEGLESHGQFDEKDFEYFTPKYPEE